MPCRRTVPTVVSPGRKPMGLHSRRVLRPKFRTLASSVALALTLMIGTGGTADAATPSAANSIWPATITLVGQTGGVTDPKGQFTVTVFDNSIPPVPIPGIVVQIDFSG